MKHRTRKRILKGAAAALACAAAVGIFLQSTVSVQAAANSLPGIDIIVNGNSSEKPFRILELTDNSENAEIGYYISGQEPSVKLYSYTYTDENGNTETLHFSTLEEGLKRLPEKERKEFVMNVKVNEDGSIDTTSSTGISKIEMKAASEEEAPLSYRDYQEKYFLERNDNESDWSKIDFTDNDGNSRTDTVQVNGTYEENSAGTGDYSKEEQQYYPVRQDVPADKTQPGLFRENIENFSYIEDEELRSAYFLQFAEVDNTAVNQAFASDDDQQKAADAARQKIQSAYDYANGQYGYYENVYNDLTEDIVTAIGDKKYSFPGENPDDTAIIADDSKAVLIQDNTNTIDSATTPDRKMLGEINNAQTAGTQANPYIYLGENIDTYPYYKYTLVGDLEYVKEKADESAGKTEEEGYQEGDIVLDDGQYWYMVQDPTDETTLIQTELSIVTGRQPVAYEDVAAIPDDFDYNYYYVVQKAWFCSELSNGGSEADPSAYQFFGWYYPSYPDGEDIYLPVSDGEIPTYYVSEALYTLTPGTGDYDFVPGGNQSQMVQVNHMYYQSGYENHDWLKKYVFHLEKEAYDDFNIQVDTRYAGNVNKPVHANVSEDAEDTIDTNVSSYDLIYVNGLLSAELANEIAASGIPCIINMSNAANKAFQDAFASFIKDDDSDGNYVTKKVYVFKGNGTSGTGIVNNNFARTFTSAQEEGFEEITRYIEQENQYRDLGEDGTKLDPLSKDLSQARAVEYIINYQYKRSIDVKNEINVLEIMPDNNCKDYTDLKGKIETWLGVTSTQVQLKITDVCCYENGYGKDNINSELSTYWHSKWGSNPHNSRHYIDTELQEATDIKGFTYTPRQDGNVNGLLQSWTVECYDEKGNLIQSIQSTDATKCKSSNADRSQQRILFKEDATVVPQVKKIRLYFDSALEHASSNPSIKFAVCSNLGIIPAEESNVNVTTMTASEFVGHIDDFASEYDMIYINGTKKSNSDTMITGSGELCYSHVGSGKQITAKSDNTVKGLLKLLGQLDTDYDQNWVGNNGMRRFAPINTYGQDGSGYYRGSGNDMTSNQCEELLDFVKSGYPVIAGEGLVSKGKVNEAKVDNSSWYYQFLSAALDYQNVMRAEDLEAGKENLSFFANLAKPTITFEEKPAEPPRAGENQGSYINGELKYVFTIGNDSDAAPASTTYDCKLYIDLNFDGNLSQKETQDQYIVLQDEDGKVLNQVSYGDGDQRYELQAGKQYTLTRKIPDDYFKLITWKLEVSSNQNHYIHTSQKGYAKQKNTGDKQVIRVLQLLPTQSNQNGKKAGGHWILDDQNGTFQRLIKQIDDFDIQVDTIYVKNPSGVTKRDIANMAKGEMKILLKKYQMLVIGFNDNYQDIPNNNGQVEDILDFIKSGKSVLFSHDTASFINYDKNKMYGKIATTAYGKDEETSIYYDNWLFNNVGDPTWGLSLNTILRSVVGMDRYGITSDEEINGTSITSLLKKGKALDSTSVNFEELMQLAGDVAWQTNSNRKSSYAQTQAYSNQMMRSISLGEGGNLTTKANRINDGAITEYPYRMSSLETSSDHTLTVSQTHGQYYQLGLEQDRDVNGNSDGETDIVVWYCLTGNNVYNQSPNDARNNYYFYSKGNVIYTGAGHNMVTQESEIKLFINAMVAAANVTAVEPEIDFVDRLDPTADVETTRYYATDQSSWIDDQANVLENSMDFYVNVKDYNMVSADLNQDDLDKQEMTLQFYIDSDDGKQVDGAPTDGKIQDITTTIGSLEDYDGTTTQVGSDDKFHLTQNNAFKFTLENPESYLRTKGSATSGNQNGYKNDCKIYVKVTSTVYLYGEPKNSESWASIDLKQRQLFELN